MFSKNMSDSVKTRAGQAAGFNTETVHAEVKKVYTDGVGNVTHADVRVDGETQDLRKVENASGTNLYNGSSITLNYARGNRFGTVIIGAGDGGTGANIAGNNAGQTDGLGGTTDNTVDLSGVPILLADGSPDVVPDGVVLVPGANTLMEDTPASVVSGGIIPARRTVSTKVMVTTALPDPAITTLSDGTLLDLIDSYANPLGMYRLDRTASLWRRRDAGGGASAPVATAVVSGTVKTDVLEADPVVVTLATHDADIAATEPDLGNPSANGHSLTSTTGGVRSWVPHAGQGTLASRPVASAMPLGMYYGTDVNAIYFSDGSTWYPWTISVGTGTAITFRRVHVWGLTVADPTGEWVGGQATPVTATTFTWPSDPTPTERSAVTNPAPNAVYRDILYWGAGVSVTFSSTGFSPSTACTVKLHGYSQSISNKSSAVVINGTSVGNYAISTTGILIATYSAVTDAAGTVSITMTGNPGTGNTVFGGYEITVP